MKVQSKKKCASIKITITIHFPLLLPQNEKKAIRAIERI